MSFTIPDALSLIRSALLLLKEETEILASPEDADYFRRKREKAPPIITPPSPQPIRPHAPKAAPPPPVTAIEPQPPIPPAPEPKVVVKAAEPPPEPPQPEPKMPGTPSKPSTAIRSILEKVAPELAILEAIPSDASAKQIANRWKTKNQAAPISILTSGEPAQHKALLAEITTAIDVYFGPARLIEADPIEKEKQWNQFLSSGELRLVVVCDSTLWQLQNLRQFYKETPSSGSRTLSEKQLFLLPDLSLYLKDPLLKRSLWKALCSKLS